MKVPTSDGGFDEFKTKEGVEGAVTPKIMERFQSALVAPCHQGSFFEDVGPLANRPVSQQILEGTYKYPQDLNPATRFLFEEAVHTYVALLPMELTTYVSRRILCTFGRLPGNALGPCIGGCILDIFFAASFCPDLSLLHAAKLSICVRNGVTLTRWGKGLMVLLEKILGNVFVHKLCAICLIEADFNWWSKLVFVKQMMQQAIKVGSIPQECYAKKHSHCNYAVLTKQFFCDSSHSLHHPAGLGECDLGDCYD